MNGFEEQWAPISREFAAMDGDAMTELVLLAAKTGFAMGLIAASTMTVGELRGVALQALAGLEEAQKRAQELNYFRRGTGEI